MPAVNCELKVKDVMAADPVCVEPSMTIRQLARVFAGAEISGVPVVDKEGRVIGVVSKTDLIRRWSEGAIEISPAYLFEVLGEVSGEDEEATPEPLVRVEDLMTEDAVMVTPNTPAGYVARLMFEKRIHRIVVVDHDKFPVGIVTSLDLLGVFPQ